MSQRYTLTVECPYCGKGMSERSWTVPAGQGVYYNGMYLNNGLIMCACNRTFNMSEGRIISARPVS